MDEAPLLGKVRPAFPGPPPAAVALAMRLWGRLHGLVTLEIYGHLRTRTASPDQLVREELDDLVRPVPEPPGRRPEPERLTARRGLADAPSGPASARR
ncbi:TetR-like C-terminal domain-containing protein [Streptomyces sp. NPDC031705]|uniref:TetR-like C-terminal domain-containing protein n=1 Tax=Streptomyces sp. NPDC031705 TaxID=3155729 RepID=UPI0033F829FD